MKTRIGIGAVVAGALLAVFLTFKDGPQTKGSECFGLTLDCLDVAFPDGGHGRAYRHLTVMADPIPACVGDAGSSPDGGFCGLPAARFLLAKLDQRDCFVRDVHRDPTGAKCAAQPNAVKFHPFNSEPWECATGIVQWRPDAGTPWAGRPWVKKSVTRDEAGEKWRPDGGMCWHPCNVTAGARHPCVE